MGNWQQYLREWVTRVGRSPLVIFSLMLGLSLSLWSHQGWATSPAVMSPLNASGPIMVDSAAWDKTPESDTWTLAQISPRGPAIPEQLQIGKEIYLETCAECHIPIPPEVLPTESWKELLQHHNEIFNTNIKAPFGPSLLLMWSYLNIYSRALPEQREPPVTVNQSEYFRALHPRVDLPDLVTYQACATCHPGAAQLDYRALAPEWENSP